MNLKSEAFPRRYRVCSIDVLPADSADLIDEDYLCPIVIESNGECNRVILKIIDPVSSRYSSRYRQWDFRVIMKKEQIHETDCAEAIRLLNEELKNRHFLYRFDYDSTMIREEYS